MSANTEENPTQMGRSLEWANRVAALISRGYALKPSALADLVRPLGGQVVTKHVRQPVVRLPLAAGCAVLDPETGTVYTKRNGKPADLEDLMWWPDLAAVERNETWRIFARGPRAVNFQIGDVCNARCFMCWQDARRRKTPRSEWHREMRASVVERVLEREFDSLFKIELVSYGEPLLNPDICKMLKAVKDAGDRRKSQDEFAPIMLSMITNGSLLHRYLSEILEMPGYLTISMDGAEKEAYEKIRRGLTWEPVVENIQAAVNYPGRHRRREIGVNFTLISDNLDQIYKMGKLCSQLRVDYLSILHGDALENTSAAGRGVVRSDPELFRTIHEVRNDFPNLQVNDYVTEGRTLALPVQPLPGRGFCPLPWLQYDVGPDGRTHPCCRSHDIDLGSVESEVWDGEPLEELRRQILHDDVDPTRYPSCAACSNLGAGVRGRS